MLSASIIIIVKRFRIFGTANVPSHQTRMNEVLPAHSRSHLFGEWPPGDKKRDNEATIWS